MSRAHQYPAPDKPLDLDQVVERWPVLRQSSLAKHDDCALSSYFDMAWARGWSSGPAAMGIIFHRFCAECLREMRAQDSEDIDVGVALAILEEVMEQRDVPDDERVRIPLRERPNLRWMAIKFANDNRFSVRKIVDIEHRLQATLSYPDERGVRRERVLSGQLDALIGDEVIDRVTGEVIEEAIVIDWKSGWGLPPRREADADDPGISYHGYFQQRFYGWLVMRNYPSVRAVTLREFYVRRTDARPARIERADLDQVEKDLADLVMDFDLCLSSGRPTRLRLPGVEPWNPSPGKHCAWCVASHRCPIERSAREKIVVTNQAEAQRAVAELEVSDAVRTSRREALRPYVELHGPTPSRWAKGRRSLGLRTPKTGKSKTPTLTFFTPEGADRVPTRKDEQEALEQALDRSIEGGAE